MTTEEHKQAEHAEHVHDENCDHDHDHDEDDHDDKGHKASKGEKKFKKAIAKMGMKPVEGIDYVTLRTQKDFIMYIDAPDVVTTGTAGSYIIFGEVKFKEFGANAANKFVEKVKEAQAAKKTDKTDTIQEEADEEETEDAGTLDEQSIKTLMEYANCGRAKAIKCLKKTNGDVVEAITLAS